jgi:hypothetical protein
MLPCYLYEYFKPAEARDEKGRTAKEIFDRKPERSLDRGFERNANRGSDRYPADRNRKPDFKDRDRKTYGPRNERSYPPGKKS